MTIETMPWNPMDYFKSDEQQALFIEEAFLDGDPQVIASVVGRVARARGITKLAEQTGLSRMALYKAFGKGGNPTLATLTAVLSALGLKLQVVAAE